MRGTQFVTRASVAGPLSNEPAALRRLLLAQAEIARRIDEDVAAGHVVPRAPTLAWVWWQVLACTVDADARAWEGATSDLAQESGLSERTIRTALHVLQRWGWLRCTNRGRAGLRMHLES